MSKYRQVAYRPFGFMPGGYQRLGGSVSCLSISELFDELERLRDGLAALVPEDLRPALQDLDELYFQLSQHQTGAPLTCRDVGASDTATGISCAHAETGSSLLMAAQD